MRVVLWDEFDVTPDVDRAPRIRMYCRFCEANVDTVRKDCGIGSYEYWGAHGRHVDMRNTCIECGYDDLEGAHTEDEAAHV